MTTTITIAGFTFPVTAIVLVAAVAQFALISMMNWLSKEKLPKLGIRSTDRRLAISAGVLALAWTSVFAISASSTTHVEAGMITNRSHGSCSSIESGMSTEVLRTKLGKPDDVRSDEETRGPGATIWIYRDSRCAVHILDDQVEFID